MPLSEPRKILYEYLNIELNLKEPPEGRSNKPFKGYIFSKILSDYLKKYLSKDYKIVIGPLWIKDLEWIEWDCAVVKKDAKVEYNRYDPDDVIALFECKVRGVYGGYSDLPKTFKRINNIFEEAKSVCSSLRKCIYVSLMEAKPKKDGINYYEETKKNIENSFILFNSRSVEKLKEMFSDPREIASKAEEFKGEWNKLVEIIRQL